MQTFAVLCVEQSGCVFVKGFDFFVSQGGLSQLWGARWRFVAADSVEHARRVGCSILAGAKAYERQAKP